ncbi:hypothetical protein KP77_04640 [Jeotgalibacillus alimentarius]|uniref:Activator of Hsp90 ATPase homologue 1/2-like C-terminal domain-containing protein n=1 Tax=Jeotgalibacillus alimentarius TaxID=135826 RepID=A0A0C2WBR8_9BACL|nr:SRPBCC domain-containing protein [Jeotgalibacillus alimentarius]KIL53488.1 hypothetical protein KP77_04640 [Jeotgalibacillus alimentarius]
MKETHFSIHIHASRERVWKILWDDETFRDWADLIDEGTYMKGLLQEGQTVEFISSVNGYGVTSLVEKLRPHEYISFRHSTDTKETGQQEREQEWTGGRESYTLTEENGGTLLVIKTDIPKEQEETFAVRLPQALERIKELAEEE